MNLQLAELTLPISIRVAVPLTDDELMRLSNANKPYKIERTAEGEITIMTPVGSIGGMHEFCIASQLFNWVEHDGTGIGFGPNTGFNLRDGSCLSPDAAWQPLARWNALTPKQQAGYPPLCPEFLIEIRSRTDSRRLLEAKMQLWLENGAQLAWLLDPIDSEAILYLQGSKPVTLKSPEMIVAASPVEGFSLSTGRLWSAA